MFNLKFWLNLAISPKTYVWIEIKLIKQTKKALLIEFDGKQIWLPKAWIKVIVRSKATKHKLISIKISQCHWDKSI